MNQIFDFRIFRLDLVQISEESWFYGDQKVDFAARMGLSEFSEIEFEKSKS